jgi:prepilin-type N-terminal cleavage/methylation domain-containing protein
MHKHDSGFTLLELLVATALALIVVTAGATLFRRSLEITDTARLIGSTDHAMQAAVSMMVRDFMQAGQGVPKGGMTIPSGTGVTHLARPAPPGSSISFDTTWVTFPAVATGGSLGPAVVGVKTDIISVVYADATLALNQYPLAAIAANGSTMTVDNRTTISGADGLHVGDLILFVNPLGSAVQYVTGIAGQVVTFAASDPFHFNQRTAPQGSILSLQSGPGVYPPTTAIRIWMVSYFVDATTDATLPRLVRQVNWGTQLAIALGVENLQFSYDLVDGITNPSNVETPADPLGPSQIRKINIALAARSLDRTLPANQFVRNSMATSVELRSLSFVDRYK